MTVICVWCAKDITGVLGHLCDRHYTKHPSGVEAIDICRHENFNIGNAIKYLMRRKFKGTEVQDLRKAIDYINYELEDLGKNKK